MADNKKIPELDLSKIGKAVPKTDIPALDLTKVDLKKKESTESLSQDGSLDSQTTTPIEQPKVVLPDNFKPYVPTPVTEKPYGGITIPEKPKNTEEIMQGQDVPTLQKQAYETAAIGKHNVSNAVIDVLKQKAPDDAYAYKLRADNYMKTDEPAKAKAELDEAIVRDPNDPQLYHDRAMANYKTLNNTNEQNVKDANVYVKAMNGKANGDYNTAMNLSRMYAILGDTEKTQYWKTAGDNIAATKEEQGRASAIGKFPDWFLSKYVGTIAKPLTIPVELGVMGTEKIAEGVAPLFSNEIVDEASGAKVISGGVDVAFGLMMASPAGALFNTAIEAGNLVGANEITDWAFAPVSKILAKTGVDEAKLGEWSKLGVQVGNFLPFMMFGAALHMEGKEKKVVEEAARKLVNKEPVNGEEIKVIDETVANVTAPEVKTAVESVDTFVKDTQESAEIKQFQQTQPEPTYSIGTKLYTDKAEFLAEVKAQKERGVEQPDAFVFNDPITLDEVIEIISPRIETERKLTELGERQVAEGKGTWRSEFNSETDAFRKASILRAIAEVSKDPTELKEIREAAKGMPEESNITYAVDTKLKQETPTVADKPTEVPTEPKTTPNEKAEEKGQGNEVLTPETVAGKGKTEPAAVKPIVDTKISDKDGTPITMYQGRTTKGLKSLFKNGEGWFSKERGVGVQFADAEKHLKLYDTPEKYKTVSNSELKGEVYAANLDIKNPMYVDLKETMWDREKERAKIKEAKENGNDGLVIMDNGKIRDAVVFDESQIKIIPENQPTTLKTEAEVKAETLKSEPIKATFKSAADKLRSYKIQEGLDKPATQGISDTKLWNDAIDVAADIIETTGDYAQALSNGMAKLKTKEEKDKFTEIVGRMKDEMPKEHKTAEPLSGIEREKSILKRLNESTNLAEETKTGLKESGLTYKPKSQEEARSVAKDILDSTNMEDAVLMAESGKFGGDVNSLVFAESLDRLGKLEDMAKTSEESAKFASQWADISIRYDNAAREAGRFVSAVFDYYKKSPLGLIVKENIARGKLFDDWIKNKESNFKELFEEIISTEEGASLLKGKFENFQKQERASVRETRRKKIVDIFDSAKLDTKQMYSTVIPPQLINAAIEGMKQATLAGESVLSVIEMAISKIDKEYGEKWDKDKFRKYWTTKLDGIDKTDRKVPDAEKKLLDRIAKLEKAISDYKSKTERGEITMPKDKEKPTPEVEELIKQRDEARGEYQSLREKSDEWKQRKSAQFLERFKSKMKGLSEKQKEEVITRSVKKLIDSGALEYADFRKIIADALGIGEIKPAEAAKMKELAKRVNAVMDAQDKALQERTAKSLEDFKKAKNEADKAARELETMVYKKASPGAMFWNITKLNTLGLVSLIKNVTYNLAFQPFVNAPKTAILTAFDYAIYGSSKLLSKFTDIEPVQPTHNIFKAQGGFFRGVKEGVSRSMYQFKTGLQDRDYFSNESWVSQIRPSRAAKDLWAWGKGEMFLTNPQVIEKLMQTTAGWNAEFIARSLNVGDKPFRFGVERSTAEQIARNEFGIKKGVELEMFHNFPKEEAYRRYKEKGLSEADAREKSEYVKSRVITAGERAVMQNENFIAKKVADFERFIDARDSKNDPMWQVGNQIIRAIRTLNMPYVKIPLNVAWNLYNLANPMMAITQSAFYFAKSLKELKNGDSIAAKKSSDLAQNWIAHGIVGFALSAGTAFLVSQGIVIERGGSEDKKKTVADNLYVRSNSLNISGFGRLVTGGDPTMQNDDILIDLPWFGIIGNLINVNANTISDKKEKEAEEEEFTMVDDLAAKMKHTTVEALGNGVFSGSNSMMKAINQGGGYLSNWGLNMVNLGTNFIQPATYAQFSKAMLPEKTTAKADNFFKMMVENQKQRDILFRLWVGAPKSTISMWGDPIKREPGVKGVAYNMLGITEKDDNKFGALLYDQYVKSGNDKLFPPAVPRTFSARGKQIKLTTDEQREFETRVGQLRKNYVAPFMYGMATVNGKRINGMDDDMVVKMLQKMYKRAYDQAKKEMSIKYPRLNGLDDLTPTPNKEEPPQ